MAYAQDSRPAGAPGVTSELPPALIAQLDQLKDFALDFDQPAYYDLLRHVRTSPHPPGHAQPPIVLDDWNNLAERPRDFRGIAITIEGVVGANRGYEHIRHRELGKVWQLELTGVAPQPCACTVICTEPADDVPLGAAIRITGYFVIMRNYLGPSQRTQSAALLIAAGPTQISGNSPSPIPTPVAVPWGWMIAPAVGGMLLAWLLLRRAAYARRATDLHALHARRSAPESLAADLADWAADEDRDAR